MPTARYLRISPKSKGFKTDIDISGFKLLNGNTQLDLSAAVITANFTPTAGSLEYLKRDTIVENEVLTIPSSISESGCFIYIDLGSALAYDCFQIGFALTDAKSLTKFAIHTSTNNTAFTVWENISKELKLKFNNPWTFSNLTASTTTGYPAFINKNFLSTSAAPDTSPIIVGDDLRSFHTSKNPLPKTASNNTGINFRVPISSFLTRGKYYFEISSENGLNRNSINSSYIAALFSSAMSPVYETMPALNFAVGLHNDSSGKLVEGSGLTATATTGGPIPYETFLLNPSGKTGFNGGISIDCTNGQVNYVNSPYTPTFRFTSMSSYYTAANAVTKLFFILATDFNHGVEDADIQFNFGQSPFIGPVPSGFNDRIGQRWEMEIDPLFTSAVFNFRDNLLNSKIIENDEPEDSDFSVNNRVISNYSKYFIKGNISQQDGLFRKKRLTLVAYPEMFVITTTSSSEVDGTYEFLNVENRQYLILSSDVVFKQYKDEVIGPLYPNLME